jgi:asparagine synthase (glutamine-hydrolysing)
MCGIAGLMTHDGTPPPASPLRALEMALRHRGPDGDGRYGSGDVGMVQTRLAIIDLATGDQPLYEPGGAALIANGEIYNYIELRSELGCGRPAAFSTESDCELPLHLYRRYGLDFTAHLRGMYAIALHDPTAGQLILARDPFGIKPLYYAETPRAFAFASEPGALIEAGIVTPRLVRSARNELLQMQFTTGRETIFGGIDRVLPGETVVVRQGRIVERRRREALPAGAPLPIGEEEALGRLDEALRESVRIHERSDVPFGMFLSGGIDSTAVLVMMARLSERPVKAFTIGFAASDVADERAAARGAAQAVGAEHVEIVFDEADFWRLLPEVVSAVDDPSADYAILPTYALARAAREAGLKVILSGEGGDELFGGYGRYRSAMRPWWAGGRMARARGMLDGLGILRAEIAGWRDGIAAAEARNGGQARTSLQVAQAVDCADWLPNDLLIKLDRCLMAHSTEGRTPYLDTEVAALAFRLPDDLKVRHGLGKWLLRRWLAERLPEARPFDPKRGLTVPVARWMGRRAGEIGPLVARSAAVREICQPDAVERLFAAVANKRAARAAWSLLFYALWHRRHIERAALPPNAVDALADAD